MTTLMSGIFEKHFMELSGGVNFKEAVLSQNANKPLPQKADGSLLCIL
ncbi:hypothetical protein [Paenibacillus polymyxa]|nr:hypothetical protein [Paenibacillus polymyxa]AJW69132.1 hypothetical protein PPE_05245 [Paenibacillus polymyxa E681]